MAPYYPLSQRHFGFFTKGKEWMTADDNTEYKGPYHWYGSSTIKQSVFTGASKIATSKLLIPYKDLSKKDDAIMYDKITTLSLNQWVSPILYTPSLSADDKLRGYIMRYFVKKINDVSSPVIEIDLKQYKTCKAREGRHINGFLYDKLSLRWKVTGPQKDVGAKNSNTQTSTPTTVSGVEDSNRRTAFAMDQQMPGIADLLRDLTKYTIYDTIQHQAGAGMYSGK